MTNIIEIIAKDLIEKNGGCDVEDIYNVLLQFSSFKFRRQDIFNELKTFSDITNVEGVWTFLAKEITMSRTALAEKLSRNIGRTVIAEFGVKKGGTQVVECKVERIDATGKCHVKRADGQFRQYDNDRLKMFKLGNCTYKLKK